jgi:hypothetical protein
MNTKAGGRAVLILATGLCVCFAVPSLATTGTDGSKSVKYYRHYVHHRSSKVAVKSTSDSKNDAAANTAGNDGVNPATLPPSVANANAQLAAVDTLADSARAMTARANDIMQAAADAQPPATSQVVAPDQLNDVDRALREDAPPQQQSTLAMASAEAPGAPAPAVAASSDSSSSDQTSLIGKIFIGFGTLLTLASAARMFMA